MIDSRRGSGRPERAAPLRDAAARVGSRLEREPSQTYELCITPRTIVVEGSEGYYRFCTLDEIVVALPPALRPR